MNVATKPPPADADRKAFSAYIDLESDIRDLPRVTGIAADLAERLISRPPGDDGTVSLVLDGQQLGYLMFAIYKSHSMAMDLEKLFDEKWPA